MTENHIKEDELRRLVVEEIDEARDTFEIARQLAHAMPLRSFKDVLRAAGEKQTLAFRGKHYDIAPLEQILPEAALPVEDLQTLVERAAQLVRLVPAGFGADLDDPAKAKRFMRRSFALGQPPTGVPPGKRAFVTGIPPPGPTHARRGD